MWAAQQRIPYIMLATEMEPTRQAFQLYHDAAAEQGYQSGPQNLGYLWKVHVDETEELAEAAGRKYIQGPSNPFLAGNEGTVNPALVNLPGLTSRRRVLPTQAVATANRGGTGGVAGVLGRPYEQQIEGYTIICGTPKTVIPKIRHVLEYLRTGGIFFWDGDGAMTHDDAMRSLRPRSVRTGMFCRFGSLEANRPVAAVTWLKWQWTLVVFSFTYSGSAST